MSISLFEELDKGGYEASLITTYSIDFPFYEDVLLTKMRSRGMTHHVLLADKRMCQSVISQRPPKKAGKQYSLAMMKCSGAFHPKIVMLLGKKKGLLAVGSHNVTFSGFGKNLELTNIIKFEKKNNEEYISLFKQAFNAFKVWLNDYGQDATSPTPKAVFEALDDTLKLCPWLKVKDTDAHSSTDASLLFSSTTTESLWQQLQPFLPTQTDQIIATSPFFDKSLAFSKVLLEECKNNLVLGVQPTEVIAPCDILTTNGIKVVNTDIFQNTDKEKYIHAKAIYFNADKNPIFICGSANLSSRAWLDKGKAANAEAVLVRIGESASIATESIGFLDLINSEVVPHLPAKVDKRIESDSSQVTDIDVITVNNQQVLNIEIKPQWKQLIELVYINDWQEKYPINFKIVENSLVVEIKDIAHSPVLSVFCHNQLCSTIIVHYIDEIKHCCTTGAERKIQEAWGSLNTEHPDIKLLFDCLDKLSCFNNPQINIQKTISKSGNPEDDTESTERELVVDLATEIIRNPKTGKVRSSQGDISQVLDIILYSLYSNLNHEPQNLYGEDSFGRNEEDLVGTDDETPNVEQPQTTIDIRKELAHLCRKKIKSIINRLTKLLKQNKTLTITEINAALVTVSIIPPLVEKSHKENVTGEVSLLWIPEEGYELLLNALFDYVFDEKLTPLDFSREKGDALFSTDESGQLLGHVIWLMYQSNYSLKPLPTLSFSPERAVLRHVHNSRLLFVFQRFCNDVTIEKVTQDIFKHYADGNALKWLGTLEDKIDKLLYYDDFGFCSGYGVAISEGAFNGYRLVVDNEGKITRLASSTSDGKLKKITTDKLVIN